MLPPHGEDVLEHAVVGGPRDREELRDEVAARLRVMGEGAERHDVGVVGRDRDEPVVAHRVRRDPVVGQAGELLGSHPDAPHVLADVLAELLAQQDGSLGELAQPRPRRLVAVDAGAAEVAQRALEHAGRVGVEATAVDRREHGIQLGVEAEVGVELLHVLGDLLGALAHRLVGVNLGEERADRRGVGERELRVVPQPQHLEGLARRLALSRSTRARARDICSCPRSVTQSSQASVVGSGSEVGVVVTDGTVCRPTRPARRRTRFPRQPAWLPAPAPEAHRAHEDAREVLGPRRPWGSSRGGAAAPALPRRARRRRARRSPRRTARSACRCRA